MGSVDKFWEALMEDNGGQVPLYFKSGSHASEAHGFSVTDQESPPPADATVPSSTSVTDQASPQPADATVPSSTVEAAPKTDEAPRHDVPPPAAHEKKDTESSEGEMEELVGSEKGEKVVQQTDKIAQESLVKESKKTEVKSESSSKGTNVTVIHACSESGPTSSCTRRFYVEEVLGLTHGDATEILRSQGWMVTLLVDKAGERRRSSSTPRIQTHRFENRKKTGEPEI